MKTGRPAAQPREVNNDINARPATPLIRSQDKKPRPLVKPVAPKKGADLKPRTKAGAPAQPKAASDVPANKGIKAPVKSPGKFGLIPQNPKLVGSNFAGANQRSSVNKIVQSPVGKPAAKPLKPEMKPFKPASAAKHAHGSHHHKLKKIKHGGKSLGHHSSCGHSFCRGRSSCLHRSSFGSCHRSYHRNDCFDHHHFGKHSSFSFSFSFSSVPHVHCWSPHAWRSSSCSWSWRHCGVRTWRCCHAFPSCHCHSVFRPSYIVYPYYYSYPSVVYHNYVYRTTSYIDRYERYPSLRGTPTVVDDLGLSDVDGAMEKAWELLAAGEAREARRLFDRQMQQYPSDGLPRVGYALAAALLERHDEAQQSMREALRHDPDSLNELPDPVIESAHVQSLLSVYEARAAADARDIDAMLMLSAMRYVLGDPALAYFAVDTAIERGDSDISARNLKGLIHDALNAQPAPQTQPSDFMLPPAQLDDDAEPVPQPVLA